MNNKDIENLNNLAALKLKELLNSPKIDAYFDEQEKRTKIKRAHYDRFEKWLENNDFHELMLRLVNEHGEEWKKRCFSKGCEVYPNNKLQFIIDYVIHNYNSIIVKKLDCDFPNYVWFFKGYYFQIVYGQGSYISVYNNNLQNIINA